MAVCICTLRFGWNTISCLVHSVLTSRSPLSLYLHLSRVYYYANISSNNDTSNGDPTYSNNNNNSSW